MSLTHDEIQQIQQYAWAVLTESDVKDTRALAYCVLMLCVDHFDEDDTHGSLLGDTKRRHLTDTLLQETVLREPDTNRVRAMLPPRRPFGGSSSQSPD